MHPLKTEKLSYLRAQASILRSSGLSVKEISKLLNKSVRWVVKWSAREEFEDRARTGRPAVLTKEAKRVIEKAKYKRGSSTRKMSQQIQSKGLAGSRSTVWRYMNEKGWKPLRQQKKPLLTEKQRRARLKFNGTGVRGFPFL